MQSLEEFDQATREYNDDGVPFAIEGLDAFRKANGEAYAEAHNVIFVNTMRAGVLDATNVMVLCPNHHRQGHYGLFEIVSADSMAWTINIDGKQLVIFQTQIW